MKYKVRKNYSTDPQEALIDILKDRGVEDIENFLRPSAKCELNPYDLDNIKEGAEMLLRHLRANSKICFNVDPDADGFSSSSILWLYIKSIFPEADLSFMIHDHKQHGLDDKIDWLVEEEQFDLVICPDSSSYHVKEHARLSEIGTDCLVLDHHAQEYDSETGEPIISNSPNTIVINNQLSPNYPNKALCGAGVVYKFCEVLDDILGIQQAKNYIDLAAFGEIADVMDRTDTETNYIMIEGLKNIKNKGFRTLIEAQSYSLKDKAIYPYKGLTTTDVAFYIAPLINAITRVGTMEEKENMFYCFIDPDRLVRSTKRGAKPGDTETAAEATARCGSNAKARQKRYQDKALDFIEFQIQKNELYDDNIIFIELDPDVDVPPEMTGLIAMQVVSRYHKPCIIGRQNADGEVKGSARSDGNFNGLPSFKQFLEDSGLMLFVAGHDAAFGAGISFTKINSLLEYAKTHLDASAFDKCYKVDYELDGQKNNCDLLYALSEHPEFFGNHIEEIKLIIKNISLANLMVMGANKDSIKISYNGVDYVRFKDSDFIDEIMSNRTKKLNIYCRPNLNYFNGEYSIQCFIDDYELVDDTSKYDF